jgi:hypothetical protein
MKKEKIKIHAFEGKVIKHGKEYAVKIEDKEIINELEDGDEVELRMLVPRFGDWMDDEVNGTHNKKQKSKKEDMV